MMTLEILAPFLFVVGLLWLSQALEPPPAAQSGEPVFPVDPVGEPSNP